MYMHTCILVCGILELYPFHVGTGNINSVLFATLSDDNGEFVFSKNMTLSDVWPSMLPIVVCCNKCNGE